MFDVFARDVWGWTFARRPTINFDQRTACDLLCGLSRRYSIPGTLILKLHSLKTLIPFATFPPQHSLAPLIEIF